MARAPREACGLLTKALREPDPLRAVELFLAARLLHMAQLRVEKDLANVLAALREIREILQSLLKNPSK